MKGILSRMVSLTSAVMFFVSLVPGIDSTVSAATAIAETPLAYFDHEEFTEMGAGLPKMPMSSMAASGFSGKGTESGLLDSDTKVYGYGGRDKSDAAVKMQFKQGAVVKDEEWSLASFSIDQNGSKGNFTKGTNILTFVDMATSGEQDANVLRDLQLGVFSVTNNKTVWPTIIEMAADGNFKFAGAGEANFKYEPKTWYRFAVELYGGTAAYSAWLEEEKGWTQIVDHAYYTGTTDPETGENNTETSGLRVMRIHLKAKKAGSYGDLYTDNFALYVNKPFNNDLANAVSDAADLQFSDFKGENEDAESVTEGLNFSITGKHGSAISFVSDHPEVIAEDGTVTPASTETKVNLTAAIGNGENVQTKTFSITVPAAKLPAGVLLEDDFGKDRTEEITAKMEQYLLVDAGKLTLHNLMSKDMINTPDKVLCQVLAGTNKSDENITFGYKLDQPVGDVRITMAGQLAMNGSGPGNNITAVQLSSDGQNWTKELKAGSGLLLSTDPETMYLDPDYDAVKITEAGLSGDKKYTNPKAEAWAEYTLVLSDDGKAAVEELGGSVKYVRIKFIKGGKLWKGSIRKVELMAMPELPVCDWNSDSKITVSEVTKTGAKLTWDPAGEDVTYHITLTNGESTVKKTVDATEIVFDDLTENTDYNVSVDAMYQGWMISHASLTGSFKTEAAVPDPGQSFDWEEGASVTVENVTRESAALRWPAVAAENVNYKVTRTDGAGGINVQTVEETGITYSDLTAETDYNVSIDVVQEGVVKSTVPLTGNFKTAGEETKPEPGEKPLLLHDVFTEDRETPLEEKVYAPFTVGGPLKLWEISTAAEEDKHYIGKAMRGSNDSYSGDFAFGYEFNSSISDFEVIAWCGMNDKGTAPAFVGDFHLYTDANGSNEVKLTSEDYQTEILQEFDKGNFNGAMREIKITLKDSGKAKIAAQTGLKYWKYTTNRSRHWAGVFRDVKIYGYDAAESALQLYDINTALNAGDTVDHISHDLSLPAEIEGYRVEWFSDRENIIGKDGKLHSENIAPGYYGGKVVLSLKFYRNPEDAEPMGIREFTLEAYKNTDEWSGEDFINYDLEQFTDANQFTAPQPANALATNVDSLPEGVENGSSFSWSIKEETEFAKVQDGKLVITQKKGEDVSLTLVLTATKDGASIVREYPINILQSYGTPVTGGKIEVSSGSGKENVKKPGFAGVWTSTEEDKKPWIQYNLDGEYGFMTVVLGDLDGNVNAFRLMNSGDGEKWETVYSGQSLGAAKQIAIPLKYQKPKYFRAEFTPAEGERVKIGEFMLFAEPLSDDQVFDSTFAMIEVPKNTTKDLSLLTEGIDGAKVNWKSDNTSVISDTGKVTRGKDNEPVVMRATVSYHGESRVMDYPVTVLAKTGSGGSRPSGGGGASGGGSGSGTGMPYVPENENPVKPDEGHKPSELYKDLSKNHWAYSYIKELTGRKVLSGAGDGYFYPENNVTREEFLKMLLASANVPVSAKTTAFLDVDENAWYAPYVASAYELGIVKGIEEKRFGIGEKIQRQDMAVMTARLLDAMGVEMESGDLDYADTAAIAEYALGAVENLTALSIMNGDENHNFNPEENATRAEAAKIVSTASALTE